MSASPRVVIIGAGIVGTNLADELASRGWTNITVVEQGPLELAGGSTSHAPGLVFQTNPSKTMTEFASYTVNKLLSLSADGVSCFNQLGGLELATTEARLEDLKRKLGYATSWGIEGRIIDADECEKHYPLLNTGTLDAGNKVLGGLYVPSDGLGLRGPRRPAADRAAPGRPGVTSSAPPPSPGIEQDRREGHRRRNGRRRDPGGHRGVLRRVLGPRARQDGGPEGAAAAAGPPVREDHGAAGARRAGTSFPTVPGCPSCATRTRTCTTASTATGSASAATPTVPCPWTWTCCRASARRRCPSTACPPGSTSPWRTSLPSWEDSKDLLPALRGAQIEDGFNGIFSFTPDGGPLMGESPDVEGFFVAEAVWVTHSAGVARAMAELLIEGQSRTDLHGCELTRFEQVQTTDQYVSETSQQNFVEIYDILHPLQPKESPRDLRVSPFNVAAEGARRVLPGVRRLGAPALVRGQRRPARGAAGRVAGPGTGRLVRHVPLPHLRSRSVEDAHRRRAL